MPPLILAFAKILPLNFWTFSVLFLIPIFLIFMMDSLLAQPQLLTDPFLQFPTDRSIKVVWFTEFPGIRHTVVYGENLTQIVTATTQKLSRTREDKDSRVAEAIKNQIIDSQPIIREIWRHEAEVIHLTPGVRVPYQVKSETEAGQTISSRVFTLTPTPAAGTPLKILLTSDHQLMPMTSANLQKVTETIEAVDAVFLAGDLVNVPDRASEWFDDVRGGAFFPCLQGRAAYKLERNGLQTVYHGGELIQSAPLFPTIGNHEVMGRFSTASGLNAQFHDPLPRKAAEQLYQEKVAQWQLEPEEKLQEAWLKEHSFNTDTYEEIFSLPSPTHYYAISFGDIRLVSLYITNIWRTPSLDAGAKGKYREREEDFDSPERWGYGQHIFEPIVKGSPQYQWLEKELSSAEFQQAKYKIVMFHHPPHSLGDNIVPAYTDPVSVIERDEQGKIKMIRYQYPKSDDYIIRDAIPLLEKAGVQLVLYGHTHIWNRFRSATGLHFLETSNVGNTYGAYLGNHQRSVPPGDRGDYVAVGDPNGLEPIVPSLAPLLQEDGQPMPYIASNDLTVFSIFETEKGIVSSYYFDTRKPDSKVVKFDQFQL